MLPTVRNMLQAVVSANEDAVKEAFRRAVTNPKYVRHALELVATVNREIGPSAAALEVADPERNIVVRLRWSDDPGGD